LNVGSVFALCQIGISVVIMKKIQLNIYILAVSGCIGRNVRSKGFFLPTMLSTGINKVSSNQSVNIPRLPI